MARRKKGKKAKKNHGEEEEVVEKDRLSDLPDCILLHILSFLPEIRFCIRTALLSKRWNNLWASLPDLIFHRRESRNAPSFKKLVRNVLNRRENLPLKKLSFNYFEKDKSLITRIIKYAMSHNVQHLSLYVESASFTYLSPLFNISLSLKTLKLLSFDNLHLLQDLTLPSLNTLYLFDCSFWKTGNGENETISIDPFVGLCNLKILNLLNCLVCRLTNFKISGPQLDSLIIIGCNGCNVEIFAPKLRFFTFKSSTLETFSNLNFPLLEIAVIDAGLAVNEEFVKSRLDFINMFRGLYNAQVLLVSSRLIKGLMEHPEVLEDQSSPFVRLKILKVKCPAHLMSSFNIPDDLMKYFGENIPVEKIKK